MVCVPYIRVSSIICYMSPCREVVNELQAKVGTKIFQAALSGKVLESDKFLDNEDRVKLKRCIFASQVHDNACVTFIV